MNKINETKITRGSIIWWTFVRIILVVLVMWLLESRLGEYSQWWSITIGAIVAIGLYPAQLQFQKFKQISKSIVEETLCTTCRHFDSDQLLCKQLDLHVTAQFIPCYGEDWEPLTYEDKRFGDV